MKIKIRKDSYEHNKIIAEKERFKIELGNGKEYYIIEDRVSGNLVINKSDDSIKIIPQYSNVIEIE